MQRHKRTDAMILFSIATLSPVILIVASGIAGFPWGIAAVLYITVLMFCLDRLITRNRPNADPDQEFPAADKLLALIGLSHLFLMVFSLWAVSGDSGLTTAERGFTALATALFLGHIAHPAAHELIHRPGRNLRLLGRLIYASMLYGHHASAHLRVHHIHVGTKTDPNSARYGESFYRFAARAWIGGFRAGLRAENHLRRGRNTPLWRHPYALYLGLVPIMILLALSLGGPSGLGALAFMAFYAHMQMLLADYVQHYGLRRIIRQDGTLEPVGPQHSWNATHVASAAMTLNAPRHSDHHVSPIRPYPALQLRETDMPCLPHSLPVMAVMATVPPLWRRVMDPLCDIWQAR